jgi:hypothetical protein
VPDILWVEGVAAGGDDGGRSRRELDASDVVWCVGLELLSPVECCRDRLGLCDGAWGRAGACGADGDDEGRTDGVRGDGVGVGDVGAVPGGAWVSGHSSGDVDRRGAEREHDGRLVRGRDRDERDGTGQCSRDGVSVGDGTRGRAGAAGAYRSCEDRRDGMRGNGVGVGDGGAVPDIFWVEGDAAGGDDGGRSRRELDASDVVWCVGAELFSPVECCQDRLGLCDGAWGRAGACGADGDDEGRTDGLRGDGVGVGDVGAVLGGAWVSGHSSGDVDRRGAEREHDGRLVRGRDRDERDGTGQCSRDGVSVGDGTRGRAGAAGAYRSCEDRRDGMRGDRVGVGDVGAVSDIFWVEGDAAGGDDGGRAVRERQRHVLGGCGRHERGRTVKRCGDGVSVVDGAWVWSGACVVFSAGTDGGDGMRGDGVGVGDVGAVPDILGGDGDSADGDDGGRAVRERQRHALGGCGRLERDRTIEWCGDGVSVVDGAWVWTWACFVYSDGTDGGDGMRGDEVGVGDVGAVPDILWVEGDAAGGDDGGRSRRELDASDVVLGVGLELLSPVECCQDRLGLCDGAWGRAGARGADGDDEGRTDGVRGDGVGVGDVGAVPGGAWVSGHSSGDVDRRGAEREHDGRLVRGRDRDERDGTGQCSRDGVSVGDGTRGRAGAAGAYRSCEDRRDGMRGNGVGVGDGGAVPDIFWGEGNAAGGDDGGRAVRERQRHVLGG